MSLLAITVFADVEVIVALGFGTMIPDSYDWANSADITYIVMMNFLLSGFLILEMMKIDIYIFMDGAFCQN